MRKIYLMGDIHGSYKPIKDFCIYQNSSLNPQERIDETDTMILLGDAGLNYFFNRRDDEVKEKLGSYKLQYFVIRGNHEERPSICAENNPDAWEKQYFFSNQVWVEKKYPYIKYAEDGPAIYNIGGRSTLVIPGAYSVDRQKRLKEGWSWFPAEQLTKEEIRFGKNLTNVIDDYYMVLSHTCPLVYEPTDLFLPIVDQSMVDKTMERYLNEIELKIKYKIWFWGHYHQTRVYPKYNDSDKVMLYNDKVFDLIKYQNTNNPYDALISIHRDQG